ncbi:hypothetical protein ACQPYK_37600 [Streptosporangium sp. CA-135522]|uniref:hypothetical protein n=1 Tax=Streptosporangium sp. CA-135522 TaxID=3240072 RepID=UPI003D8C8354
MTAGPEGLARTLGVSVVLDVVLGLLVAVVLPLAIVAIPNTISVVAALLPPEISQIAMMRAHGLALPAMVLTVPLAGLAVRRVRAAPVLVAGLTLLAVADAAGGYANSTLLVGVLRVLHGIGAGLLVPATLVAVWERSPLLRAVWGGMLAVSLLTAQALALWPLDEVKSWRVTLQPYPMLTGIALALAALYLVLWMKSGEHAVAGGEASVAERGRLLVAVVPAVGIAALALGSTFDWPPGLLVLAALLSILVLFGLASLGASDGAGGRVPAYTMLAVGIVVLPTAAQVTYIELGGLGGPGLSGLWPAFAIAGATGVVAAMLVSRLSDGGMPLIGAGGLAVMVAGLCAVRLLLPVSGGLGLILPLVLLGVGAAVALTSALRSSGTGATLFALSLFFPGVLSGFLLGSGVQVTRLKGATTSQALVDAFVGALHLWALVGGGLVVAVIVLCAVLARRSPAVTSGTASTSAVAEPGSVAQPPSVAESGSGAALGSGTEPAAGSVTVPDPATELESVVEERPVREPAAMAQTRPEDGRPEQDKRQHPEPEPDPQPDKTGTLPVVPPPTPSPEDGLGEGPAHP